MDPPGFEPGASALQGRRSPSLSYGPICVGSGRILVSGCHQKNFFMCKEVIQPQVPLRLPCYDFALLKEPRFDISLRLRPHPNPFWVA